MIITFAAFLAAGPQIGVSYSRAVDVSFIADGFGRQHHYSRRPMFISGNGDAIVCGQPELRIFDVQKSGMTFHEPLHWYINKKTAKLNVYTDSQISHVKVPFLEKKISGAPAWAAWSSDVVSLYFSGPDHTAFRGHIGVATIFTKRRGQSPNSIQASRISSRFSLIYGAAGTMTSPIVLGSSEKAGSRTITLAAFKFTNGKFVIDAKRGPNNPFRSVVGWVIPRRPVEGFKAGLLPGQVNVYSQRALYADGLGKNFAELRRGERSPKSITPPNGYFQSTAEYAGRDLIFNCYVDHYVEQATKWRMFLADDSRKTKKDIGPYRLAGKSADGKIWLVENCEDGKWWLIWRK